MKYHLDEAEQVLTIVGDDGEVTRMGWDHPVTQSELEMALATIPSLMAERAKTVPAGTNNLHRRYVTRFGTIFVSFLAGPPTWWFPRVLIKRGPVIKSRWSICVGWFRRGIAVAFWGNSKDEVADALAYWQEQA